MHFYRESYDGIGTDVKVFTTTLKEIAHTPLETLKQKACNMCDIHFHCVTGRTKCDYDGFDGPSLMRAIRDKEGRAKPLFYCWRTKI